MTRHLKYYEATIGTSKPVISLDVVGKGCGPPLGYHLHEQMSTISNVFMGPSSNQQSGSHFSLRVTIKQRCGSTTNPTPSVIQYLSVLVGSDQSIDPIGVDCSINESFG